MNHLQLREQAADRLRDGLLLSLRELERRRQRYSPEALGERARESRTLRIVAAVAAVGAAGTLAALTVWQRRRNRPVARLTRLMRKRRDAVRRAWHHPELLTKETEPPLGKAVGKRLTLIAVSSIASALAGRAIDQARPSPRGA
ncbi:MAG TPA: hypothetical protein VK013_05740 [Myxococcaceae bacterium]|nr:hypothetical protein [Myxococcaceae bacterium]